jgi:Sec-independent protein translocase protein TatA
MFDLGPEKIMMVLAAVCIFLGPKEIPTVARKIGVVTRQLRTWQDTLRAEVNSVLVLNPDQPPESIEEPSMDEPPAIPTEPVPELGDSFL